MKVIDLYTELNALGIKFEPIGYVKAPAYPYGIYVDDIEVRQPDTDIGARIIVHTITIELYHPALADLETSSKLVDNWINAYALNYRKQPRFIIDEDHYCMTYTLQYSTKERNENT